MPRTRDDRSPKPAGKQRPPRSTEATFSAAKPGRKVEEGRLSFTPLTLLATIMKSVLGERITSEESDRICLVYYDAVQSFWSDD